MFQLTKQTDIPEPPVNKALARVYHPLEILENLIADFVASVLFLDGLEVRIFSIVDSDVVLNDHFNEVKVIVATLGVVPQMMIGWILKQLANLYIALSVVGI